jgi:long-chain acyl-CoA synthetase
METICCKFLETKSRGEKTALMYARKGKWLEQSWQFYYETVQHAAGGLRSIGVKPGTHVAIWSNTRPEWAYMDMAILGLGAVTVPLYQSMTTEELKYILENSQAEFLVCENMTFFKRFQTIKDELPKLKKVILIEKPKKAIEPKKTADFVVTFEQLEKLGEKVIDRDAEFFETSSRAVKLSDLATLVYTSGTTGAPRGVVLTHAQVMSEVTDSFPLLGVNPKDRSLCFLPFAHILSRIELWGHILIGYTMAYAESIDRIKENLMVVKPTLMMAVPRIFEKIYTGILSQAEIGLVRSRIFSWALEVGREMSQHKAEKNPVPLELSVRYGLAKKLVFDKISSRLGGQLRFAVCGGAPLNRDIAEFFHAANILVLEGYGLTETTGAVAVNTPFDYRFGTVGKAMGEVKLKIADDGEILVQSRKVMREYWQNPEATANAIVNGWFHTGDIGEISPEGYLRVTDRKKDLLKTAGGKYVAPQKLEGLLKTNPYISQVHIYGDQKKYVVALLTLNLDAIRQYAEDNSMTVKDEKSLTQNAKIKELIRGAIAEANSHLASFESIKNFAILPTEFTVQSGELTPSLKVKRKVVDERYRDILEKLY